MESEEDDVEAEESGISEEPDVVRKLENSLKELQVRLFKNNCLRKI